MSRHRPAILLVDPVRGGKHLKSAARDLGLLVASVYTLRYSVEIPAHDAGDDVSLYSADLNEIERQVSARGLDVKAVVPAMEGAVQLADLIAERLSLPGNDPALASARRNKAAMRERARATGLRIPEYRVVRTTADVLDAVHQLGFPAIVKPTMGACSQGVTVLPDADALGRLDELATHDMFNMPIVEWLVERYVRGREFAVNFYSSDGDHRLVDIWQYRQPDDRDYDFPVWETVQIDETDVDFERVDRYVRRVLDAFGVRLGPSHTEVKCNDDGVYLIEIGARLPGGPAPEMWANHGKGFRPYHDAIECYLGRRPAVMDRAPEFDSRFGSAAIRNEDVPGTLKAVHGIEELNGLPGIEKVMVECSPGDHIPLTRDSLNIPVSVFVTGPDTSAVIATLASVRALVTLETEPVPGTVAPAVRA
ncbi:ATP-grasp domain-containing protein [Pseudonocardia xinjiangensis]|uniref:ATP-grasp domain-containing protein n=1 Tax=Pseudonocardia xinjiangensis TaxID=75289 RepID=UPI003D925169